jgi:hypothetical protein
LLILRWWMHRLQVSGWHGVSPKHHDLVSRELPHDAVNKPRTQAQRQAHAQLVQQIAQGSDLGSNPSVTTHRVSHYVLLVESYEVLEAPAPGQAAVQAAADGYAQDKMKGLARRMAKQQSVGRVTSRTLLVSHTFHKKVDHQIISGALGASSCQ